MGAERAWDYVVIGAGSAGCAVASRLSESADTRVLLLEAGDRTNFLAKVVGASEYVDFSRLDWGYRSQPDPTRGNRTEQWLRGRAVGGTSTINGTNFVRGASADYDRWAALGNEGWSAQDVIPLFQAMETYLAAGQPSESRGRSGPLRVREVGDCLPITEAFIAAAEAAGYRRNPDYNGVDQEGVGYAQVNQRRGLRCSAADAFLIPVLKRRNLCMRTNAQVHRLLISAGRATGVEYRVAGRVVEAQADRVIVCAGAINTPKLLMLSGIGAARELRGWGIEVAADLPAVGRNLMEHPLVRVVYRSREATYNPTQGWRQKLGLLAKFIFKGEGPLASFVEAQGFLRSSAGLDAPDIQLHFVPLGLGYTADNPYELLPYPSVSILVNKSYPMSRGYVTLASADPEAAPLIQPNMLGDERDVATLVSGVETVRRIMTASPMAASVSEEVFPGPHALVAYVRNHTEGAYHPSGTCRMGVDDEAVVTSDLRVRGLENLWVADASIMPELISGNINAACMMIGDKLGRELR